MPEYAAALSLREARERYFAAAGLGAGGYDQKWVPLAMGPLRFAIPNTAGRVRAVRYHDLHHVVTGYGTDWTGEGEIGAWEVASGCRDLLAAWVLNLYAMQLALWFAPRAVWRAFVRGRHSRNLYARALERGAARRVGGRDARPARARERAARRVARRLHPVRVVDVGCTCARVRDGRAALAARVRDRLVARLKRKEIAVPYTCFDVSLEDKIAHLVLKRPEAYNTMIPEFWSELPEIVRAIDDAGEARAIVISSTGKHFTAGMDLAVFTSGATARRRATASSAGAARTCAARCCGSRRRSRASTARACPCSPRCRAAASAAAST